MTETGLSAEARERLILERKRWIALKSDTILIDAARLRQTARDLNEALAAYDAQAAEIERKDAALASCRDTFVRYVELHRAKGTPDGDDKAIANGRMADLCRAALKVQP